MGGATATGWGAHLPCRWDNSHCARPERISRERNNTRGFFSAQNARTQSLTQLNPPCSFEPFPLRLHWLLQAMPTPAVPPLLVAEDDAHDMFLWTRLLTAAGATHPLHIARDGREAIRLLTP